MVQSKLDQAMDEMAALKEKLRAATVRFLVCLFVFLEGGFEWVWMVRLRRW
jgi:hypothetical protein